VALPSDEDYTATERARCALEAIGVTLSDHIIVADGDYVSMAESGYLT
jgi:DNA repair protein RadC